MTTRLRLFVSSPADVAAERARVDAVAGRLNGEFEGLVHIEVLRWETGFYTAERSFQEAIDAAIDTMHGIDLVVCILWKRVGSELDPTVWRRPDGAPYESGTVLEVETAVAVAQSHHGVPDVYLFRKRAPIAYAAESYEAERMQHLLMESAWRRWTTTAEGHNTAGYQNFTDPDDFESQLEPCLRQWLERKGIVHRAVWDRRHKGSPFRGLNAFAAEHAPVFFGREMPIARVVAKLRAAETAGMPFLLLVGASGAGKSSLLGAGLVPRVSRPGTIPGIDLWRSALVVPGGDPLLSLASALFAETALGPELRAGDFPAPALLARCFVAAETAPPPVRAALARAARREAERLQQAEPRPARLLIAVDQVERMFVEADRVLGDAFAAVLQALVREKLASVIVALRSDAYARFQLVAAFVQMLETGGAAYNLLPPGAHELEDIVQMPVAACEPALAFEAGEDGTSLADRLVADAQGGDALPLLQITLSRLYDAESRRGDGLLRFADYPGMGEAVTAAAEEALAGVNPQTRAELPALVAALVADVAVDPVTQGPVPSITAIDPAGFAAANPARRALIDAFVARHLLISAGDGVATRIRPTHEALLRIWPEAVALVAELGPLIRIRHTLEPIVREWSEAAEMDKPGHLAISPSLLEGAEQASARLDLPAAMREFVAAGVAAGRAAREREEQEQRLQDAEAVAAANRRTAVFTGCGLAAALILAGLAAWQWRTAETQRDRAERTITLATDAANSLVVDLAQKFRDTVGTPAATIKEILTQAGKIQERLVANGETSPGLRRNQGATLLEMADSQLTLGQTASALDTAMLARDISQTLVAEQPGNADLRRGLSSSYQRIGNALVEQGNLRDAMKAYQTSREIADGVAKSGRGDADLRLDQSKLYMKIGDVLSAQGKSTDALNSYRASLDLANRAVESDVGNVDWQRDLSLTYNRIGFVLHSLGNLPESFQSYQAGLMVTEKLAKADPGNAGLQRDLSKYYMNIGDVERDQGKLPEALTSYRSAFTIVSQLSKSDPGNTVWQSTLAVGYVKFGDVFVTQGNLPEALKSYQAALDIRALLVKSDPDNALWERDLATVYDEIANVLVTQGHLPEALKSYRAGFVVFGRLANSDPTNTGWQRDLSISDEEIGYVLEQQGSLPEALQSYRDSLTIADRLANSDPGNAGWQDDLAVGYADVGRILLAQGKFAEALESYGADLAICEQLTKLNPDNAAWQRDLVVANDQVGNVLKEQGDLPKAMEYYQAELARTTVLGESDPSNTQWQSDLAQSYGNVGDVLTAQGKLPEAIKSQQASLEIRAKLTMNDPDNASWQHDLAISYKKLALARQQAGEKAEARVALAAGRAIIAPLVAKFPDQAQWRQDLAEFDQQSAALGR